MLHTRVLARRLPGLALIVLVAAALLARLASPAGWMPGRTASGIGLMLCSGSVPSQPKQHHAMPGMHHAAADAPAEDDAPDQPQPCAFSGVFAAMVALPATPIVGIALVPAPSVDRRRPEASVGRGLAAPPPPSHAPPFHLA